MPKASSFRFIVSILLLLSNYSTQRQFIIAEAIIKVSGDIVCHSAPPAWLNIKLSSVNTRDNCVCSTNKKVTKYFNRLGALSFKEKLASSTTPLDLADVEQGIKEWKVPPNLAKIVRMFASMGMDHKLKVRELCLMGQKRMAQLPADQCIPKNQVFGCQSTVHIVVTPYKDSNDNIRMKLYGNSDGLFTKGLLVLLLQGLNDCTAQEISDFHPQFSLLMDLQQVVAHSRINGFKNMIMKIKQQSKEAEETLRRNEVSKHVVFSNPTE